MGFELIAVTEAGQFRDFDVTTAGHWREDV